MVHDNMINLYQVDFVNKSLRLETEYWCGDVHEKTDVIFTDYFTHIFHNVSNEGNIIFDIEECPLQWFYEYEQERLDVDKNYISKFYSKDKDDYFEFFQSNDYKVFSIDSSCGLCGYVVAKKMVIQVEKV